MSSVRKFTFAISSPDEFLVFLLVAAVAIHTSTSVSGRHVSRGNSHPLPPENANSSLEICCRPQFLEKSYFAVRI